MTNVKYDTIEDYNCCYTVGDYHAMIASGVSPKEAIDKLAPRSRDNARTPYQWDASKNAGFSDGKPWIKVNPRYTEINLAADRASEHSIFSYYQELTRLRRENPAIIDGDLRFLLDGHEQILLYLRECERQTLLVVLNYSSDSVAFEIPDEIRGAEWRRLLTNKKGTEASLCASRALLPWEAEVYELIK
jgi:oligo-1,6-glucosidase